MDKLRLPGRKNMGKEALYTRSSCKLLKTAELNPYMRTGCTSLSSLSYRITPVAPRSLLSRTHPGRAYKRNMSSLEQKKAADRL
jgi:hypothetical protein